MDQKFFTLYPHFAGQCCCYHWRPDQHLTFRKRFSCFHRNFWHFHVSDPFWKISDSSGHGDKCPLCFLFPYADALASLWQLESTELFSGNVFLSGLRNPFFHYCRKNDYELSMYSLPWMFLFDYLANITELLTRMDIDAFSFQSQAGVLLVALLRTALAGLFLFCLSHYKFSLLSAEHARRYQNLLLLISELNGEVVLMQKGTRMIEDTMSTAYRLYHDMSERNIDESLTRTALQIARDVHEIKKDYNLIVRGLSSSMELNSENDGMSLDDILTILKSSLDASLPKGKRLFFNIQLEENLYTQNHYLLLSIFRNLFNNAIEAADGNPVELSVRQSSTDSSYVIEVEDHGPGIDPEDMEQIFEPGFSTKINYETGEVNRGLGLSLVKDFIELRLGGTIRVTSVPGKTVFTLTIPKEKWSGL